MKTAIISVFISIIVAMLAVYCSPDSKSSEIEYLAKQEVPIGSDKIKIEDFYKRHNLRYAFDDIQNRYSGTLIIKAGYHAIYVYFYLNKDGLMEIIEVYDHYITL